MGVPRVKIGSWLSANYLSTLSAVESASVAAAPSPSRSSARLRSSGYRDQSASHLIRSHRRVARLDEQIDRVRKFVLAAVRGLHQVTGVEGRRRERVKSCHHEGAWLGHVAEGTDQMLSAALSRTRDGDGEVSSNRLSESRRENEQYQEVDAGADAD